MSTARARPAGLFRLKRHVRKFLRRYDAVIAEKDKRARELDNQAIAIDAAVYDLKAVNPNAEVVRDDRTPAQIIQSIHDQGLLVSQALSRLKALMSN